MVINAAYKQTEIGIIPEQWSIKSIGTLFNFQGGSQPPRSTFVFEERQGYIRLLQIRDYKTDKYATYIPISLAKRWCNPDDIMIGRYGPPIFQILQGMEGAYNVALIKAVPNLEIDKKYAWFILKQKKLFEFVEQLSQRSSGQTGVDLSKLRDYFIALPSVVEQKLIANALSDMDNLIESLETLIEKKRNIMQGTMQELLSGKKRLLQFTGDWQIKKLQDFTDCVSGGTPSTLIGNYWGGSIRWMNSGELNLKFVYEVEGRITNEGLSNSNTKIIPKNCVLIGLAGQGKTRGTVAMNMIELCTNQSIVAILPNSTFDPKYLYYNLESRYNELRELSAGDGGRGGLNLRIIRLLDIPFPKFNEQVAISTVLNEMDLEIAELELKLEKYRAIKQGMMQNLLIGKIRLV